MTAVRPDVVDLWRGLHDRIEAFVRRRVPSDADVDDVVQDTFVRAHLGLARARRVDDVEAWLFRVARSAVVDAYRRRGRDVPSGLIEVDVPSRDEDPGAGDGLTACVRPFASALPEPYRQAVHLVDLDGLTHAEAARRAGVTVSGMKSRVQRGRAHLRGLLEACCRIEVDRRGGVMEVDGGGCAGDPMPGARGDACCG